MTPRADPPPPRRVLLIQLRRLGDVILATGILEDLRRAFPAAQLDVLTGRGAAPLLRGHPLIDTVLIYDAEHPWRQIADVRRRGYDWIIDGQSSPRTAWLARLSGARVRVGWGVRVWSRLYTQVLPRTGLPKVYVVRERQRFLEMLGVPIGTPAARLAVTADERAAAERALRGAAVPDDAPRVALVLSVSEPIREWPAARFGALARRLAAEGLAPVVLANPGDESRLERLRAAAPETPVLPTFDLRQLLATLAQCDVLVSGDTGPAHMATALGVPRVTIYGPTDPVQWNPGLPTTEILRDPAVAVMRVRERKRYASHPGLIGVSVEEVAAAVHRQLARRTSAVAVGAGQAMPDESREDG